MKKGLDYFPLDCFLSDNIRLLEAECGIEGFGILVRIWQEIFKIDGYFKLFDEDVKFLFSKELGVSPEKLDTFLKSAIKRNIFDKDIFEKYQILTSKEIQTKFLKCTRKRKVREILPHLLLVDKDDEEKTSGKTLKNDGSFKQSKVKESKVKESKEEESKEEENIKLFGEYKNVRLTDEDIKKLKTELKDKTKFYIERLSEYMEASGKSYKNHALTILCWAKKDLQKPSLPKQKSKFNNYTDTNKKDYSEFTEKILEGLLSD